jgi:hypothetical protein
MRMTNPKLVKSSCVKADVWVRKPGPIAEVAIRKAAPSRVLLAVALEEGVFDGFKYQIWECDVRSNSFYLDSLHP